MGNKIAILGLGAMGSRMAKRLLDAEHDVVVFNRTAERAQPLVDGGATLAETPRAAAEDRDIVISMVRDDDASKAIWLDPERGALAAMRQGALAIESSTLTLDWTKTLAERAAERGIPFLDAPVAGSRPQADAGQLIYLVGGEDDVLDSAKDVLSAMGGAVHHAGPTGAGTIMKLAVNALLGVQVAALGEVLGMARKAGIADSRAVELLAEMPITSPALKGIGGLMAAKEFAPMFPIDLVEKDFGYVVGTAAKLESQTPIAAAVRAVYAEAKAKGLANDNITGVAKLFE